MLMKLTIIAKVSKPAQNIQRSNEQDAKVEITPIPLVFSTISGSILVTIWQQDGNYTCPHYRKPNVVPMDFQQKIKVNNLLQHRKPSPPK